MDGNVIDRYFKKGADIEISSEDDGFRGSWYVGTVIRPPRRDKSKNVLVEYKDLMKNESRMQRLREELPLIQLRPAVPRESRLIFNLSDEVDALYNDGWWEGVITDMVGDGKYAVFFRGTREQLNFKASQLRIHREWVYGKWVPPFEPANNDVSSDDDDKDVPLPIDIPEYHFRPDELVEVSSDEEGFEGAWFAATIIKKSDKGKYLVCYQSIYSENEATRLLREEVNCQHLRPCPPDVTVVDDFEVLEQVDALYNDGWWAGVVSRVLKEDRYSVYFKGTDESLIFKHSDLRVHQEWINGEWIIVPKAGKL